MRKLQLLAKRSLLGLTTFLLVGFYPMPVLADSHGTDTPTATIAPSAPPEPVQAPAATAAPPTVTKPKPAYTYNEDTRRWDTRNWFYSPVTGRYERVSPPPAATTTPPVTIVQPTTVTGSPGEVSGESNGANPAASSSLASPSRANPGGTGSGSNATGGITDNQQRNGAINLSNDAGLNNTLTSTGRSGNAGILQNTGAGDATSGDAAVMANMLNLLQSSWNPSDGDLVLFTEDINGDVVGDLTIDPGQLSRNNLGIGSAQAATDLDVNIANDGRINNTVTLDAISGNARIADNTNAGSATTGSADAVANIVNLMNSAISAGNSFLGVLNINGNLDGDILLPPDFVDQMLANNTPTATLDTTQIENGQLLADITDNQAITNTIATTAASGNATVAGNTKAGAAATGDAQTNVTLFNLTGREVVAGNAMLVFVNVLGEWVGLIMDAPAGTTAAALGGDVTQNRTLAQNVDANITNNGQINNNVLVNAQSGDASLLRNTNAGNAATGDATASANIANIMGSQLSLSDWFGVLFINVFGSWKGSFGVNTAAGGNPVIASAAMQKTLTDPEKVRVFQFVPADNAEGAPRLAAASFNPRGQASSGTSAEARQAADTQNSQTAASNNTEEETPGTVLASTTAPTVGGNDTLNAGGANWQFPALAGLISLLLLAAERLLTLRQRRQSASTDIN